MLNNHIEKKSQKKVYSIPKLKEIGRIVKKTQTNRVVTQGDGGTAFDYGS